MLREEKTTVETFLSEKGNPWKGRSEDSSYDLKWVRCPHAEQGEQIQGLPVRVNVTSRGHADLEDETHTSSRALECPLVHDTRVAAGARAENKGSTGGVQSVSAE